MTRTELSSPQIKGVDLTVDVTNTLPIANGGTGATSIPTWNQSTSGNAATATTASACSGNAATATALASARTINGTSFNGTANIMIATVDVTVNAPGATPSINTDVTDQATFTGLAAAITSMTTNLTGTPTNGQKLMIRFKDAGTARAIAWGAKFGSSGVATLLATTVVSKTHHVGLVYDSTAALWVCIAVDATGY